MYTQRTKPHLLNRILVRRSQHTGVQLLRSVIASAAASLADYAVLVLLVRRAGLPETLAGTLSMGAGLLVVYVLGRCWVFPRIPKGYRRIEFSMFTVIAGLGALLHVGLLSTMIRLAGMHYLAAKAVAMAATFTWNFCLRRGVAQLILRRFSCRQVLSSGRC
ncbi:GtrA family protein [Spirochaeta africana]|uniref:Putative membrane protein n=1 Tax=Spirochaeta africana (strain ATCC 700263 / DSM 8902 / Z-7692) TaxID=889378 RepID=H9UGU2_SPIAZ|nr:GtrA family protein [Spirochaeta africana]AFG36735.1 putative membrane protein [Spirochaeta africana DSM 8902]